MCMTYELAFVCVRFFLAVFCLYKFVWIFVLFTCEFVLLMFACLLGFFLVCLENINFIYSFLSKIFELGIFFSIFLLIIRIPIYKKNKKITSSSEMNQRIYGLEGNKLNSECGISALIGKSVKTFQFQFQNSFQMIA